jgi:hypothetical protein
MGNKQVTDRAGKRGADGFGDAPADGHGAASQVQSVDRALTILDILARHGELGVTEIAASLGVHKSTAFRLVSALEQHRLVEQLSERGKYRLGFGIVRLASATTARMNLSQESRPFCRELATEFNETVNVAVLDTGAAVNIAQEQGQATVSVQNWIGRRTPPPAGRSCSPGPPARRSSNSPRTWPGIPRTPSPAARPCGPNSTGSADWAGRVPKRSWRSG